MGRHGAALSGPPRILGRLTSQHGPVLCSDPTRPVMFYNGATKNATWRIGWIAFDESYTRIVARCSDPMIVPPRGEPTDTDIAFAASAVAAAAADFLYYSTADKDMSRATVQRV